MLRTHINAKIPSLGLNNLNPTLYFNLALDVQVDAEFFHDNTKKMREFIKESTGLSQVLNNDKLGSIARLPYTGAFRLDHFKSDCPCCTGTDDDSSSDCSLENPSHSGKQAILLANKLNSDGMEVYGWDLEWGPESWEGMTIDIT